MSTLCARCGYLFLALFTIGWVPLAGFVPPPDPAADAATIAAMFRENTFGIRLGMCLCVFATALLLPWGGAVIVALRRAQGGDAPLVWAWTVAHACLTVEFVLPCMVWAVAAFRPEAADERMRAFNDLAWLPFLGITSTAVFQAFALAYAAFSSPNPVFPRWFGYFQIWDALLFAPAGVIMFFHDGPLAWNGLIAFWVAIVAAAAWFLVTTPVVVAALRHGPGPDLAERVRRLEERLG
jgi:hypothetical protein